MSDPKVEDPKVEDPKVEDPKVEDPKVEDPKVEDPKVPEKIVPEKYDLRLTKDSLLTDSDSERIARQAREQGLTQDEAALRLRNSEDDVSAYDKAQKEAVATEHKAWEETMKTDKEIGGEFAAESAELSKRVLEAFGEKSLMDALDATGLGNYPELIRCFTRIGKAMDSDKLILGKDVNKGPVSIEDKFYGPQK